jgi:hypothetical protein
MAAAFPALAAALAPYCEAAAASAGSDWELRTAASGRPTLAVGGALAHSARDPEREAARLAESADGDGPLLLLGFGLGYVAEAAAARRPGRPIVVVEKRPDLLAVAFASRDLSALLEAPNLVFLVDAAAAAVAGVLEAFPGKPSVLTNRALAAAAAAYYADVDRTVASWSSRGEVNAATLRRFGGRWVRNLASNLAAVRDIPGVAALAGRLSGLPVLVAAAGPSLDEALPILPDLARRAAVVAVDTSLRAVLGAGVDPDFVLVADPQYWNARHLDRCAPRSACLVAESSIYPAGLRAPFARRLLYASQYPLGRFMEERVDPKGSLGAGGSVATTAWDFARLLGGSPLWIVGLDLGFPGLKTHFRGALFEERVHAEADRLRPAETRSVRALRDGRPSREPGADGGIVLSDQRMKLYASWFAARLSRSDAPPTEGLERRGLAIPGLANGSRADWLSYPEVRPAVDERLGAAWAELDAAWPLGAAGRAERWTAARRTALDGLAELGRIAAGAAAAAAAALAGNLAADAALARLDAAAAAIAASAVKDIASFLFPPLAELESGPALPDSALPPELARHLEISRRLYAALETAAASNRRALAASNGPESRPRT